MVLFSRRPKSYLSRETSCAHGAHAHAHGAYPHDHTSPPTAVCAQADAPRAGLRIGDYKVLCWQYTVAGIGYVSGSALPNVTGPCKPCHGASDPS